MKKYLIILVVISVIFLSFKADDYFEISKNLEIFTSVYKEVNTTYVDEVKPGQLIRAAINGMLQSLDPYTNFYSEAQAEDYRYEVTGTYAGIGASVRKIDGDVVIEATLENYPAQKAGLWPGDKIIAIDGVEIKDKKPNEVNDLLKGNAGTSFEVKVDRQGKTLEKTLSREKITIKNVPYFGMLESNTGYIKLTGFTPNAGKEVREAVVKLKTQGADKLILDLRGNGGGLLFEAINIVNVFVPKGEPIVVTKGKYKEDDRTYKTTNSPVDREIPLVVLINGTSASASEIVSGALQDLDRAVLVGRNSFGKGLVQATRPLKYGTQMKVTIAKYYIPSGRLIQRLDYGNKMNGKAIAVADSAKQKFKTRNGREVVDGEGIQPDIKIESQQLSEIAQSLLKKNLIFKYANRFRSENQSVKAAKEFDVSTDLYSEFQTYLVDKDYEYTTETEKALKKLIDQSKDDKYYNLLKTELETLETELDETKQADLKTNASEIKELLEYEILKRYYYERGGIEASFDDDLDLKRTHQLFANLTEYNNILGN